MQFHNVIVNIAASQPYLQCREQTDGLDETTTVQTLTDTGTILLPLSGNSSSDDIMKTPTHTFSSSPTPSPSSGVSDFIVGGAVGGGVLALLLTFGIMACVVIMISRHRNKTKVSAHNVIGNALYGQGKVLRVL